MEKENMPKAGSNPAKGEEKTNRFWDFLVLWPFIYFALLMVGIPLLSFSARGADLDQIGAGLGVLGALLVLVHFATIVGILVTYVYAVHRLYTQTKLPVDKKKMWLILVVVFNVLAIPFLHFQHLRK